MTNKTVTLSRELAERLDSPHSYARNLAREELRAALAEPVPLRTPLGWVAQSPQDLEPVETFTRSEDYALAYAQTGWTVTAVYAEPVPPAGGNRLPERPYASEDDQSTMTDYEIGFGHGGCEMWDKFQPHITRLQAEVELLKLDLRLSEQTKQKFIEANETFGNLAFEKMTLQAELTKARELLSKLLHETLMPIEAKALIAGYLHQSAPAAKDGE